MKSIATTIGALLLATAGQAQTNLTGRILGSSGVQLYEIGADGSNLVSLTATGCGGCGCEDPSALIHPVLRYCGVLVGPDELRQVFNDTDTEVLWLSVGALEELEFLPGEKTKPDLSLIYPVEPKQLPKELAGVEWPAQAIRLLARQMLDSPRATLFSEACLSERSSVRSF